MTGGTFEVFLTNDPLEIEIARGILEDSGIEAVVRDLTARSYPLSIGHMGEYRLVVAEENAGEAGAILGNAVEDGILPGGTVLGPDDMG